MTNQDIFKDASIVLVNSNRLHSLRGSYFKFYIDVIFLSTKKTLKKEKFKSFQKQFSKFDSYTYRI